MTISDAAEHFGVSKEAIHNRIRRGSLQTVVENDIKMVLLDENAKATKPLRRVSAVKTTVNSDRYYKLLEEQNAKLQSRVETLETETRTLRDQKELMLIQEREKIEQIYKEKDEQLKNILSTISSQFMLSAPIQDEVEVEAVEAEIEVEETPAKSEIISLKKYIKKMQVSQKKAEKLFVRFQKRAKDDERIITVGSKHYLDTSKYDYSDLFKK